MDPCPFVRLIIESLSLKLPGVHPSSTPCYAKLSFGSSFPSQTTLLPLCSDASPKDSPPPPESTASAPGFHLDPAALHRLSGKPITLKISVFTGRMGHTCGLIGSTGKLLGDVVVGVNLCGAQSRPVLFQSGWRKLGGRGGGGGDTPVLHLVVRSEPDPRFVFQFGGEPECSPVVFQIQGNIRQPVFSCKFTAERNNRTRSLPSDFGSSSSRKWMRTFSGERDRSSRERKGWMIIIYDLSGSAVAAASMITPFVASPGSDRVCRSNPGAWLILRPNGPTFSSWKPWGRLEAWRERAGSAADVLGYKFELVTDSAASIPIAQGAVNAKKGGRFCIDGAGKELSPVTGFVMCSSVEGKNGGGLVSVQVAANHVSCMADAALFVALSAAIDLSMDACQLFSRKLRKEFLHDDHDSSYS